jgi:hypothetical protein
MTITTLLVVWAIGVPLAVIAATAVFQAVRARLLAGHRRRCYEEIARIRPIQDAARPARDRRRITRTCDGQRSIRRRHGHAAHGR